jgi:pimeloyl-ACP methyl ester carboxylesterase
MKRSPVSPAGRAARWLSLFLMVVLLATGVGPAAVSASTPAPEEVRMPAAQGNVPRFEPAACMFDIPIGLVEGQDVDCGYLIVPERYAAPDGPTIRLAVAVLYSLDPNPAPDPLVMAQGGPGGSTIDTYMSIIPLSGRLRANRDIVMFDQRGTLYSQPSLVCPEYLEMVKETLDLDLETEESNRLVLEALQSCRDRLVREGVNLDAFDSLENAADVESLRVAMGYDQINLYGVSYGTLLALHVMRDYSAGLRSVILDAVVPPQINFVPRVAQTQYRSFTMLFEACEQDAECRAAYPNLREVFFEQVDRLNEEPVFIELTDLETGENYRTLLNGDALMSTVFQMMYATDLIPFMPRIIYEARANEFSFLERILSVLVFDRTMSVGMYYTVLCAEDGDISDDEWDFSNLPPQIVESEEGSPEYYQRACQLWDVETLGPEVDQPVSSDVPTLILSGDFDPITPPAYAEAAAETLPNSYEFVFPWGGHGAAASGECQDQIILDFLNDPNRAPDASCIAAYEGMQFLTPTAMVRLPVLPRLLNLQGTTGIELLVFILALLFLLTALVIYPLVWLVRMLSGNKPAARPQTPPADPYAAGPAGYPAAEQTYASGQTYAADSAEGPRGKPGLYRLAPWLSGLNALLLMIFTVVFVGVVITLVTENDYLILMGLPGSARPLFLIPIIAGVLAVLMLVGAIAAWSRRAGSVWGRLYLTLLSIAALVCVGVLTVWGMTTALLL